MGQTGPTITVIDDDDSVRKAVRRLIRSAGLAVETFASAEDYLAAAGPLQSACLVLDVCLGGMSGLELQKRLASAGRSIPLVFITAHQDERALRAALGGGAVDFLRKPFDDHVLLHAVERALRASEAGGNSARGPG